MTLRTLRNKSHPNENSISSGWQKANISRVCLETSVQPQCVASWDLLYRSIYHPDIQ